VRAVLDVGISAHALARVPWLAWCKAAYWKCCRKRPEDAQYICDLETAAASGMGHDCNGAHKLK
jgi:hypothetical protein